MNSENDQATAEGSATMRKSNFARAVSAMTLTITALSIFAVRGMQQSLDKIYPVAGAATPALKMDQSQTSSLMAFDQMEPAIVRGSPARGKSFFNMSCFVCHGPTGAGTPGLGPNLRESKFVASHGDDQLVAFITKGREPNDPNSLLHLTMPAKGGNPMLDDAGLHDLVAFVRTLQAKAH